MQSPNHQTRKHAKYSASAMERLEACPGSAALSEGMPDKSSPWAEEGTKAHEVLEALLIRDRDLKRLPDHIKSYPTEMFRHATAASDMIFSMAADARAELLVEEKVDLSWIHPDAGGSLDSAVVEHFGTLDVFDYKYGAGVPVSPVGNLQMATYAVGVAHRFNWNFKRVRMWIIQPRIKGYDGPVFWEIPAMELKEVWARKIARIVATAEAEPETYSEGGHCHWCKAKTKCPLKTGKRLQKAKSIFSPVGGEDGSQDEKPKTEAVWRKESGLYRKGEKGKTSKRKAPAKKAPSKTAARRGGLIVDTDPFGITASSTGDDGFL